MLLFANLHWWLADSTPTLPGWFTFAAYLAVAFLSALAARRGERKSAESKLYLYVAVITAILGVMRQLKLHLLITEIGRTLAQHEGWYDQRGALQRWCAVGILAVVGITGYIIIRRPGRLWRDRKLLSAGCLSLLTFIAIRTLSFHKIDAILGARFGGLNLSQTWELSALLLVGLAAATERRPRPPVLS